MIKGIEHIGLMAKDPEKLANWYREVLDFQIIYKTEAIPPQIFIAGQEKGIIEIFPWQESVSVVKHNKIHIAIEVDDFYAALQRLKKAGARTEEPIDVFAGGKVVYFRDIEDNVLHLVYRPKKVWNS